MDIKVIRTRSEYDEALNSLSKLMDKNPAPGSKDENTLELLVLVIKDYEQRAQKRKKVTVLKSRKRKRSVI